MTMRIGIDPDLVKSGVAVVVDGSLLTLDALSFFELIKFIDEHKHQARFVLEDVEHDRVVYHRKGSNQAVMRSISQKVGMVKAIGRLLKEYLEGAGADYVLVKPLQGQLKKAKKDAEFFNRLTGWDGKSNEDKRDAGVLALYGEKSRAMRLG
jgi:hypothetical protein